MERENILVILYEMAMAIGGETRLKPLLTRTLQRLLYHTSFPAGFVCLDLPPPAPGEEAVEVRLEAVVGDYEFMGLAEQPVRLPAALLRGAAERAENAALLARLPGAPGRYRAYLRLPIDGRGVIVLLAPRLPETDLPLTSIFQPTMANLAKAIVLCRHHETYDAGIVAEREQAELALRESEARYRTLAENLPGIVYRVHVREHNRMQFFNKTAIEVTGYAAEELMAGDVCSLDPLTVPEDRARVIATVKRAVTENRPFTVEYRLRHKSGDIRHLLEQGTPIHGPDGKPLYIDGVVFDVTERWRAAQELVRTKELLEHMFESIHVLVAYMDRDFNFIRVNRAYAEADGRTPEFFPGKNHFVLYPGKEAEAIFRRVVETGGTYIAIERPFEYAEHPERGVSYWDWRVEPVKGIGGQIEGIIFSLLNVTERVQARQTLAESEEKFRSISASAQDAVIMLDDEGQIVYWNPAAERIFGYRADEVMGKGMHTLFAPARYLDAYKKGFTAFRATGEGPVVGKTLELEALRRDGIEFPIDLSVSALKLKGRWHAVGILRDITERKKAGEALRRSEDSLKEAQRIAHIGNWDLDLVANKLAWSDEIYRMFEIDPAKFEASYEAFLGAIHPDDRELVNRAYTESVRNRTPYNIVHRLRMKDGRIKYVNEHCETFYAESGAPLRSVGTVQDVTERVLIERRLRDGLERTVEAIAATIEMRDPYTAGHERRVVELATAIAREMGLAEERTEGLRFAALVHDIGKIRIPAEILSKPAALSPIEFEMIKTHCQTGHDILKGIEFPWPVARIVLEHHERLDGSGYPGGLKGAQTLLESKILTVADVVEAMSSHRPYRPALGIDAALAHIVEKRGLWYDPAAADACARLFREKDFRFG